MARGSFQCGWHNCRSALDLKRVSESRGPTREWKNSTTEKGRLATSSVTFVGKEALFLEWLLTLRRAREGVDDWRESCRRYMQIEKRNGLQECGSKALTPCCCCCCANKLQLNLLPAREVLPRTIYGWHV
ncbi:hypothetical protein CEXT_254281 [Caerostris extrusa]|uniref:Uncharacterized protein n=1 Tax=Caerostris extrusa TaxID=172846 RepID=A0AAV4U780_CAEEX|nr:hypothetical protein CEXT_254281 [Caerostris extrusa]